MSIFTKEVDSGKEGSEGLEGKLPERQLRGWVKVPIYLIAAGTIGYFANKWTGDPTGLEKKLGISSSQVSTMTFDSKEYLVLKKGSYYYSIADFVNVNDAIRKINPKERLSVGTVYVLRYDKLIVPILIKRGVTDNSYTDPANILVGELKEGDKVITGIESGPSKTATTQPTQQNQLLRMFR
jgi:hypothetical protein